MLLISVENGGASDNRWHENFDEIFISLDLFCGLLQFVSTKSILYWLLHNIFRNDQNNW